MVCPAVLSMKKFYNHVTRKGTITDYWHPSEENTHEHSQTGISLAPTWLKQVSQSDLSSSNAKGNNLLYHKNKSTYGTPHLRGTKTKKKKTGKKKIKN